jgi:hypothetical protein
LVEHLIDVERVRGSSPLPPTKPLKMEKNTSKEKPLTSQDIESHNYSTPEGMSEIFDQEVTALKSAREKILQQAAILDIVEKDGRQYAIVKNALDDTVILKTDRPDQIDYLFGKTDDIKLP